MALNMKPQRRAVVIVVLALFFPFAIATANICVDKTLKPFRHFCGRVVDSSGTPIPNATVSVLKDGIEVAAESTNAAGEFWFDSLQIGNYEFHARAKNFAKVSFPFAISNSGRTCKRKIEIQLAVGLECNHVRLVKQ